MKTGHVTQEQGKVTSVGVVRELGVDDLRFVFDGCTQDQLEFFMQKAIEQEEYELCVQLRKVLNSDLVPLLAAA